MSNAGRLEARIYFSAAVSANFTGATTGLVTVTVALGYWYPTDLIAEIQSQLGGDWTITVSSGEGTVTTSTGLVTIDVTSGTDDPWSITWTSTSLRDVLGYTGNIAASSVAVTATNTIQGMWLPGCDVKYSRHGDSDAGTYQNTVRQTLTAGGTVKSLSGPYHRTIDGIRWEGVPQIRTKPLGSTGEDFETWWVNTQMGGSGLFEVASKTRFYRVADSASYVEGRFMVQTTFDPDTMITGWVGRYIVSLPRFIIDA